jgi:hypothetical protein
MFLLIWLILIFSNIFSEQPSLLSFTWLVKFTINRISDWQKFKFFYVETLAFTLLIHRNLFCLLWKFKSLDFAEADEFELQKFKAFKKAVKKISRSPKNKKNKNDKSKGEFCDVKRSSKSDIAAQVGKVAGKVASKVASAVFGPMGGAVVGGITMALGFIGDAVCRDKTFNFFALVGSTCPKCPDRPCTEPQWGPEALKKVGLPKKFYVDPNDEYVWCAPRGSKGRCKSNKTKAKCEISYADHWVTKIVSGEMENVLKEENVTMQEKELKPLKNLDWLLKDLHGEEMEFQSVGKIITMMKIEDLLRTTLWESSKTKNSKTVSTVVSMVKMSHQHVLKVVWNLFHFISNYFFMLVCIQN